MVPDCILRTYWKTTDLNYMLINTSISDRNVQNFKFLVANLTSEIISKKTSNVCSFVRGSTR